MRYLLALLSLLSSALAEHNIFQFVPEKAQNEVQIEVSNLYSHLYPGGFQPIRITARNTSKNPGNFSLNFEGSTTNHYYGNDGLSTQTEFTFDLPPGDTLTRDVLVAIPISTGIDATTNLRIQLNSTWGDHFAYTNSTVTGNIPRLLFSQALHTHNSSELISHATGKIPSGTRSYYNSPSCGSFSPATAPEDWRAYSGVEAILLTNQEWNSLSAPARIAILQWNRLGGNLHLFGNLDERLSGLESLDNSPLQSRSLGLVTRKNIDSSLSINVEELWTLIHQDILSQSRSIVSDYSASDSIFPARFALGNKGFNFTLFLLILVVFAIFVGPVNLFVFAKASRRHRLFITTPIISLIASVIMLVTIVVQDGFGGKGCRITLMEVCPGPGENQAYLLQEQYSRTGVLLGSSFEVKESAQISPVLLDPDNPWARLTTRTSNSSGSRRYDARIHNEGTSYSGSWFQSRSEQGQVIRAIIPTRSRIEVRREGDRWIGVSSFEKPLDTVWCLFDGQYLTASQVQPGANFEFHAAKFEDYQKFSAAQASRLSRRHQNLYLQRLNLTPGRFAASSSSIAIDTFSRIDWQQSETLITGTCVTP